MSLIKVRTCLCCDGSCRAQEEKGIVIELRVIEVTGVCGSNRLTYKRVLTNRHALQFGWSISPTGLNVNGTHTDIPRKTWPRTNFSKTGFLELLDVASGNHWCVCVIGVNGCSELCFWMLFPPHAEWLTLTDLPLVENAEHLPLHTNVQWFNLRPLPPPLPASSCRMSMALSEFTCAPWC